jgi:hypothetical protein
MGIKGINVKKTRIIGKMARKKLNAIDEARAVIEPLNKPFKKKLATSYKDNPSNPGSTTFLVAWAVLRMYLFLKIL